MKEDTFIISVFVNIVIGLSVNITYTDARCLFLQRVIPAAEGKEEGTYEQRSCDKNTQVHTQHWISNNILI